MCIGLLTKLFQNSRMIWLDASRLITDAENQRTKTFPVRAKLGREQNKVPAGYTYVCFALMIFLPTRPNIVVADCKVKVNWSYDVLIGSCYLPIGKHLYKPSGYFYTRHRLYPVLYFHTKLVAHAPSGDHSRSPLLAVWCSCHRELLYGESTRLVCVPDILAPRLASENP